MVLSEQPYIEGSASVTAEEEEALLGMAWRDWSRQQLRSALCDFRSLALPEFIRKYEGNHGSSSAD
jgi:hypothetical protein